MKQRILAVLTIAVLLMTMVIPAGAAEGPGTPDSEKQYIVHYRESGMLLSGEDRVPFDVVSGGDLKQLLRDGAVAWYEEDYEVTLLGDCAGDGAAALAAESSGKFTESRWDLTMIQADLAYRVNCVGQEVRIGVIDSGIQAGHKDLAGNVLAGYNYVAENTDTSDTLGHGTFVSGIIAALDDECGMIGIAPQAKLIPLKCFSGKTTSVSYICRAIYGAVDDFDCDIINLSLGLSEDSQALAEAVAYAASRGVIQVAAVGNSSGETLYYPAAYDSVIGVGSVDAQGDIAATSQHNSSVFLAAPGVNVSSTGISGGYVTGSGTSYATPYVTAAAAVMKSVWGALTPQQAMEVLRSTAADRGAPGYDPYYGYGILDLQGCLNALMQDVACYISPVEQRGTTQAVVVYNPTDVPLRGTLVTGSYNGSAQKALSTTVLNLPAGSTRRIEVSASPYTTRLFVWSSIRSNMILSNTRTLPNAYRQEDNGDLIPVAVDLTDCTGPAFSLLAASGTETVYALQRELPDSGVYEMLLPRVCVSTDPSQAASAWDTPLTVMVNGKSRTIAPHAHVYAEPVELIRADTGARDRVYICTLCGCIAEASPAPSIHFADVDQNAWYFDSVAFVAGNGLMRGVSETRFAPEEPLDRGMFVTILYRMAGEPEPGDAVSFSDVAPDAYYARAVRWAYANGIVTGVTQTEFQPSRAIQRQEIAVMACRYAACMGASTEARAELDYRDAGEISDYALEAVRWAAAEKIMVGDDQRMFRPRQTASRAEAAALCKRLYEAIN